MFLDKGGGTVAALLFEKGINAYIHLAVACHLSAQRHPKACATLTTTIHLCSGERRTLGVPGCGLRPILSSPTFERNSLLTSTKQGPEEVHMTSVCEAPLQTLKASRQLRVYSIKAFPMKVSLEMGCCATQTRLSFTIWKSYIHSMVVLCTPSQDTWSMMYSVPSRYSCNRIPHPWAPHQRLDFLKNSKWSRAWYRQLGQQAPQTPRRYKPHPPKPRQRNGTTWNHLHLQIRWASQQEDIVPSPRMQPPHLQSIQRLFYNEPRWLQHVSPQ